MRIAELGLCALLLAVTSEAHAHLRVESHMSRLTQSDQKVGPCGKANSTWGATKTYSYAPGETIKVEINEYIAHPGWFRISFDKDGDDDFKSPKSIDPPSFMDNAAVLMDNLDMHQSGGGKRSYDVKLPDVECEKCTLQVIQVMLDKPPYDPQDTGAFSNDIYYACIDMQLKRAPSSGGQTDAGAGRDAAVLTPTSDAATPSAGNDAGSDEQPPESKPPAASTRDAGRGSSGSDASSGGAVKRDAGVAPPSGDEEEEEHEHDDEADEEDEDAVSSSPSDDGCSVSAGAHAHDLALPLGMLFLLGGGLVARRRRS
jgi:MYXO-CTERM domain-containing protein